MTNFYYSVFCAFLLYGSFNTAKGQGALPAQVSAPSVRSLPGKEARLSCATSNDKDDSADLSKLRYCVWERQQRDRSAHAFIVNFNEINSQPGLYSGMRGYSYSGNGFREGECGVKISFVKPDDFARWQCTLITDGGVYRGYVTLEKQRPTTTTTPIPVKQTLASNNETDVVAFSRIDDSEAGKNENGYDNNNRARPIITSYNDARAIIQPELIVHSTDVGGVSGSRLEVKVESPGLQIKPRRQGKLIVFE